MEGLALPSPGHPLPAPAGGGARVVIISPVRLVRDGLIATLRGRDSITGLHAAELDAAGLSSIVEFGPNVVLVDLAGASPVEVAQCLRAACPEARLISFAIAEVDAAVCACAAAGFCGYVAKDGDGDDLHGAILDALRGRARIAADLLGRLAEGLNPVRGNLAGLTARENEILSLARAGRSNKEIAYRLHISAATVKNHMHNILQKLQVSGRRQAATLPPPQAVTSLHSLAAGMRTGSAPRPLSGHTEE